MLHASARSDSGVDVCGKSAIAKPVSLLAFFRAAAAAGRAPNGAPLPCAKWPAGRLCAFFQPAAPPTSTGVGDGLSRWHGRPNHELCRVDQPSHV